jgi:D-alanyl-D-alanine carboxypeptidase
MSYSIFHREKQSERRPLKRWEGLCCCALVVIAVIGIAMGLFSWLVRPAVPAPLAALPSDLRQAVQITREHYGLPAVGAVIVTADDIEVAVSGVRKVGDPAAATDGDLWHLGSNAKAMTATIFGILSEEGLLDADAPLGQLLGSDLESLHDGYSAVTVRQLLQHRGGVQAFTSGLEYEVLPEFTGDGRAQRLAFSRHLLSMKPHHRPGDFVYSNAGYSIAAAIGEQLDGGSWEDQLRTLLMGPVGAEFTVGWPAAGGASQPWGHSYALGKLRPEDPSGDYQIDAFVDPAGDVSMRLADYGRFLQLHLRGLMGRPAVAADGKTELLSGELLGELHEPNGDYACGWGISDRDGVRSSSHQGSAGTFHVIAILQPGRGVGVAVVSNAGGDIPETATTELARSLLESNVPVR